MADPDLQLRGGGGGGFDGLTTTVEFYEDNSGSSKKMCYFRKNKGGRGPLDLPPVSCNSRLELEKDASVCTTK